MIRDQVLRRHRQEMSLCHFQQPQSSKIVQVSNNNSNNKSKNVLFIRSFALFLSLPSQGTTVRLSHHRMGVLEYLQVTHWAHHLASVFYRSCRPTKEKKKTQPN